jgi:hypothetical protein
MANVRGNVAAIAVVALGLLVPLGVRADEAPSGTIHVEQVQVAFIGSANLGGGTLTFDGQTHDFSIGGLGVGGYGLSKMVADGEVYGLTRIEDFPGAYVQGRYGAAAGTVSTGELWLHNTQGVSIHLDAEREGLALSLGGDAVYIDLEN